MEIEERELGPDDDEVLAKRPSLYDLAKIDRDRYTIVGIDVGLDGPTTATVCAIDRHAQSIRSSAKTAVAFLSWSSVCLNRRLKTS